MLVDSVEESRQFAGAAQADRASFDVEQQGRAVQGPGRWQVLQPAIGDQQHALLLRRQAPLALFQPLGRFVQAWGKGVPPPAPRPSSQCRRSLEAFRPWTCQLGARPLAVSRARRARWR